MHNSTILHATNCNGLSDVYSTRIIPWFGEKGKSRNLLILEEMEMQWSFSGCKQKQVSTMVDNDECLRKISSSLLGFTLNSNCYWRIPLKTEHDKSCAEDVLCSKGVPKNVQMKNQSQLFKGFSCFKQKMPNAENREWESMKVFWSVAVKN